MKNLEALKNIAEVSKELNIEKHVIRFWEKKFKDLKPIQKANGRRYYSLDNIIFLKKIIDLLYNQNYSIKGAIKKIDNEKLKPKKTTIEKNDIVFNLEIISKKIDNILKS
mgnify:CR=1 FL=1|tara:strand:- start:1142 stop:1471 length:330 start_codon:yes stop_codon:yes gene_type:complete